MARILKAYLLVALWLSVCTFSPRGAATEPTETDRSQRIRVLEEQRLQATKQLARLCAAKGDFSPAARAIELLRRIDPSYGGLLDELITELNEAECWESLITIRRYQVASLSEATSTPSVASTLKQQLGDCFEKAIEARLEAGERTAALDLIHDCLSAMPDWAPAYKACAALLLRFGDPEQVRAILEPACGERFQGDENLLDLLGQAHDQLGQPDRAIEAYERALEHMPYKPLEHRREILRRLVAAYDRAGKLSVIVQRTAEFAEGKQSSEQGYGDVWCIFESVGGFCNEECLGPVSTLLDTSEGGMTRVVISALAFGSRSRGNWFPAVAMKALNSDNPETLEGAIPWAWQCIESEYRPRVQKRLRALFEGDDDLLKMLASMPLAFTFDDQEAFAYLLAQTHSADDRRACWSLGLLGRPYPRDRLADPRVLEALAPLTESPDQRKRSFAILAITSYSGEALAQYLIETYQARDKYGRERIREFFISPARDRKMVERLLSDAYAKTGNTAFKDMLDQVEKTAPGAAGEQ
jgi:hypothetical protein